MTAPAAMTPGRVYRTRELLAFTANPSRWAKRLVEQGFLKQSGHGLYYVPLASSFGPVGPEPGELLRAYFDGEPFLVTGPYFWNALGLATTQMFAVSLVYNHKVSGSVRLGGVPYWFRRVRFPTPTPIEWFVVDLLNNERHLGEDTGGLDARLIFALREGRFNASVLGQMAAEFAHPAQRERVLTAIRASAVAS